MHHYKNKIKDFKKNQYNALDNFKRLTRLSKGGVPIWESHLKKNAVGVVVILTVVEKPIQERDELVKN